MGPFEGLGPDIVEDVRRIKSLTSAPLEHDLADEVLLLVYPVLLGTGKRFFADGAPPRAFELVDTKAIPSGIIFGTYKVAGPLKNTLATCSAGASAGDPRGARLAAQPRSAWRTVTWREGSRGRHARRHCLTCLPPPET